MIHPSNKKTGISTRTSGAAPGGYLHTELTYVVVVEFLCIQASGSPI